MTDVAALPSLRPLEYEAPAAPATPVKAWLAVLSVALGAFVSVTTEFLPVGLLPSIARDLHVSDGVAGLMITMPGIAAAIAAPLVTVCSGRLDRRRLLWMLTALLTLANVISALAPNFGVMLVGRLLLGISLGGFWSIAASLAGRLVVERHAPRALSIILAGISIGTIVGVPAGVVVANAIGWRATFGVIGVLAAAVMIKQLLVLPSLPTAQAVRFAHLLGLFRSRVAVVGFIATFFIVNGQFGAYTYVTPFLKDIAHVTPAALGMILLGFGLAGLAGNIVAGFTTARSLRGTYVVIVALMAGGAILLPHLGRTPGGATGVLLLWGLGFGALPMCVQLWAFRSAPEAAESASAMLVAIFQTCIATGAGWGGRVVDGYGTPTVMTVGGLLVTLGLLTLVFGGPAPAGEMPAAAWRRIRRRTAQQLFHADVSAAVPRTAQHPSRA